VGFQEKEIYRKNPEGDINPFTYASWGKLKKNKWAT